MSANSWLVEQRQVCISKRHARYESMVGLVEKGFAVTVPEGERSHLFEPTSAAWDEYECLRKRT